MSDLSLKNNNTQFLEKYHNDNVFLVSNYQNAPRVEKMLFDEEFQAVASHPSLKYFCVAQRKNIYVMCHTYLKNPVEKAVFTLPSSGTVVKKIKFNYTGD